MKQIFQNHKLGRLFFLLLLCLSIKNLQAQSDTQFWFAAPDVTSSHSDGPIRIVVSAFDDPATVTVTQPSNLAFPTYIVNVAANTSQFIDIEPSKALIETPYDTPTPATPQVSTTGLLVESTAKITAYYEVNSGINPDIFALKGANGLGLDFYVPFQNTWSHANRNPIDGRSGFVIVATEDNTLVTVTPTRALEGGQAANVPFSFTLNRGETYVGSVVEPAAGGLPSGSRIQANRPVAVTKFSDSIFSGQGGCNDLAGDQLVPVDVIGTEYVVLRGRLGVGSGTPAGNPELAVVTATQNGTQVRVNGTLVTTINAGQTYTHTLSTAGQRIFIETTLPAYVGHYAGYGCETGFAILPPVECTGSLTTRITRSTTENFTINLMTRGRPVGGNFDFTNNFTVRVNGTILFQPAALGGPAFPATFTQIGASDYYGTQYTFNTTQVPAGAVVTVESNTITAGTDEAGLFHLGFVNGGASTGTRYGYFSDFRTLDLGSDVNINYGTNTTVTADIQATNFRWLSDGVEVQNGTSNSYTVTNIQRRQTIRVEATVGDCVLSDEICVGTNEYVWDGSFPGGVNNDLNWSKPCGAAGVPDCSVDIIIPPTPIASSALNVTGTDVLNVRNLTLLDGGNLNVATGGQVNVCGNMIHDGSLNMQTGSTFSFVGTGRQNYSKASTGTGEFEDLVIANTIGTSTFNNVAGVTILSSSDQDLEVSSTGSLSFVQGYIVPEDYPTMAGVDNSRSVVINNPDPNAITGFNTTSSATTAATDYFVAGKLNRAKNATGYYSFPVGLVLQNPSTILPESNKDGAMPGFENGDWQTATYGSLTCDPNPNGVLAITGDDEYVDFGTNTGNVGISGNNSRTVEIWARVTNFNGAGLFQFGNSTGTGNSQDFALVTGTTNNSWFIRLNNGFDLQLINLPNSLNNWHHYALTYNDIAQQVTFYYDGIRIRTYDLPAPLNTVLSNGYVGRWSGNSTISMRGEVDELKVWSETRTEAQIQASFNQGCAANALQCPQATNLRAYYNFEDGNLNGSTTRTLQSRTIQCPDPTFTYQRADANFNQPSSANNVTAGFQQYTTVPSPVTGQTNICGADFDTDAALDNGFWNFDSFDATNNPIPVNAEYQMYLYNRDYGNYTGASTTVMQQVTPPWTIPTGFCIANNPQLTARSGFTGNMGSFATAQSQDITILPIELLFIDAQPDENAILVKWATLQERDNYGFEVYRAAEDEEFTKIGFVEGKGTSQIRQDYNFLDIEVQPNITYYYKLKQIDLNGNFNFTKVVSAKLSDSDFSEQVNTIYPNPTSNEFTLYLGSKEFVRDTKVEITLVNTIGEVLEHKTITTTDEKSIPFSMIKYPNGMYLLRIVGERSSSVMKVIKE
ncbi:LamG-like jellyroll fold domain-containing protein [Bernardetia sp.]|uniref:LamG-like jellyroll fold domain-containing protein n=1 Tax=Bernardetia sp. TaxID=1937974 RepID=UPI0025C5D9A8|nr:LamG-like jellyroll fold domain-containing protein [Bernardetia sp.]